MTRDEVLFLIIAWCVTIALTIVTVLLCQENKLFINLAIIPGIANITLIAITAVKVQEHIWKKEGVKNATY